MWLPCSRTSLFRISFYLIMTLVHLHSTIAQTTRYEWTYFNATVKWDTANAECTAKNSRLIKLDNKLKINMVEHFKGQWNDSNVLIRDYWIGMFDSNSPNQTYSWSDCNLVDNSSTNWYSVNGEPDNPHREFCVRNRKQDGYWRTKECNSKFQFICEKELGVCSFDELRNTEIPPSGSGYESVNIGSLSRNDCLRRCSEKFNPGDVCWAISHGSRNDPSRCVLHQSLTPIPFLTISSTSPTSATYIRNCFAASIDTANIQDVADSGDLKPNGCMSMEAAATTTSTTLASTAGSVELTPTIQVTTTSTNTMTSTTDSQVSSPEDVLTTPISTTTTELSSTTNEPSSTTSVPSSTTSEPSSYTSVPSSTTSIPSSTTNEPSSTASEPSSTTSEPSSTTSVPSSATSEPSSTTNEPSSTTSEPSSTTSEPSSTTNEPSSTTALSISQTSVELLDSTTQPTSSVTEQHISSTLQDTSSTNQTQDCVCLCRMARTQEESTVFIAKILETLEINKTNVSSFRRKYISIPDARISAQSIGYAGTAILVIVFGGLVLLDIRRLFDDLKLFIKTLRDI